MRQNHWNYSISNELKGKTRNSNQHLLNLTVKYKIELLEK